MSHTVAYNLETHIIETTVQGVITLNEMKAVFSEAMQMAIENGHFLFQGLKERISSTEGKVPWK